MEVKELDWYNPAHAQEALAHGPFDMLVAADCVYNEEHLPAFRCGAAPRNDTWAFQVVPTGGRQCVSSIFMNSTIMALWGERKLGALQGGLPGTDECKELA